MPALSVFLSASFAADDTSSVKAEYCRPPRMLPPVLITISLSAEVARCTRELSTVSASCPCCIAYTTARCSSEISLVLWTQGGIG